MFFNICSCIHKNLMASQVRGKTELLKFSFILTDFIIQKKKLMKKIILTVGLVSNGVSL